MDNNRFSSFFGGNADKWIGGFIGLILALVVLEFGSYGPFSSWPAWGLVCTLAPKRKTREISRFGVGIVFP